MNSPPFISKTATVDGVSAGNQSWGQEDVTVGNAGTPVHERPYVWLTNIFWLSVVLFGAIDCWVSRFKMNTDGISYLDVASRFASHDWIHGVNAYWSPLYPFLLSIAFQVAKPAGYWEFPLVHFVNFVVLLGSAASFEFFLSRLISYSRVRAAGLRNGNRRKTEARRRGRRVIAATSCRQRNRT